MRAPLTGDISTAKEVNFAVKLTFAQLAIVATIASALLLDGTDGKLLPFLTPSILAEWQVNKAVFAPALAASLFGMTFGSFFGGFLGDRFGPWRTALVAVMVFGFLTLACAFTNVPTALMLARFGSGVGFGALIPNAYTIVIEWLPRRHLARVMGFLTSCSPLGGVAAAAVALYGLPLLGWRGCFILVGIATLAIGVRMLWLPETPTHMLKQRGAEALQARWRAVTGTAMTEDTLSAIAAGPETKRRASVFRADLVRFNSSAWFAFFCAQFVNYGFESWLPVVLTSGGLPLRDAISAGMGYSSLCLFGALLSGFVVERLGSKTVVISSSLGVIANLLSVVAIMNTNDIPAYRLEILAAVSLSGGITGILMATIAAVIAAGYDADCRATGSGIGVAAGRLGGVTATMVGGIILNQFQSSLAPLFIVLTGFAGSVIVAALVVDRHIAPHRR